MTKHSWGKQSRKFRFKRHRKGKIKGLEHNYTRFRNAYGDYAIKVFKSSRVTSKQLNAARAAIVRKRLFNKNYDQIWVRALFDTPVSRKPDEIRMGKGKGSIHDWVFKIKPGAIFLELKSTRMPLARAWKIYQLVTNALGLPGALIIRHQYVTCNKIRFS